MLCNNRILPMGLPSSSEGMLFFFQAEDGIRDLVTGVQTCALPIFFGSPATLGSGDTRAMYIINAFAGAWNFTHTGTYNISSPAGQVKDLQGQNLQFSSLAQV